jgi:hypothetical protein
MSDPRDTQFSWDSCVCAVIYEDDDTSEEEDG